MRTRIQTAKASHTDCDSLKICPANEEAPIEVNHIKCLKLRKLICFPRRPCVNEVQKKSPKRLHKSDSNIFQSEEQPAMQAAACLYLGSII